MIKRKRRKFTSAEKVSLIRLHLLEKKPVSEVCEENDLNVNQFYIWQQKFFENGAAAFETKKAVRKDPLERKIEDLQSKITDRDEGIAELMMEHVKLKKKLGLS